MYQPLLANAQISFFRRYRYLLLEEVVPPELCALLASKLIRFGNSRLPLWIEEPLFAQWTRKIKISKMLCDLVELQQLRLLDIRTEIPVNTPTSICSLFPYQGSKILLSLELTDDEKRGSLTIYDAEFVLLDSLEKKEGKTPLLLLCGLNNARYLKKDHDPHMDWMKQQGYGYGDPLETKTHPLI